MTVNRLSLLILIIFLSSIFFRTIRVDAQSPTPVATFTPTPTTTVTNLIENPVDDPEVVALKAQLEVMRAYDDRLLETVYWALGTTVSILLGLVVFGWFTNFRVYERDKQAIREDLQLFVREELSKIQKGLQDEANQRYQTIINSAQEAIKAEVVPLMGQIKDLRKLIFEIRYRMTIEEAKREEEKSKLRALDYYVLAIELTQELSPAYYNEPLKELQQLLENWKEPLPPPPIINQVKDALSKIPKEFKTEIEAIQQYLQYRPLNAE